MTADSDNPRAFDFLLASVNNAEESVKGYDTKSQIVGVGYIFAINVVFTIGARLPGEVEFSAVSVFLFWAIVILPALMFGAVLYPTRALAARLGNRASEAKRLFYVRADDKRVVDDHLAELQSCDLNTELTYELIKLSELRDIKRKRFLRALFAAGFSFFSLFLVQLLRVEGLSPF